MIDFIVVRLADAIAAQQHHDLSLFNLQRNIMQNVAVAVIGIDAAQAEHALPFSEIDPLHLFIVAHFSAAFLPPATWPSFKTRIRSEIPITTLMSCSTSTIDRLRVLFSR